MLKRYTTVLLLVASLLASGVGATAQQQQEKVDLDAINKIKEEGTRNSKVMEFLSYMTDIHGPRLTGSPALRGAQEWAKNKFTELGLQNSHLEVWGPFGRGWSLESFQMSMLKPQFSPIIGYPKAWSGSTKGTVKGEVVLITGTTDADLEKYKGKLKGAIVAFNSARPVAAHFKPEGLRATEADLLAMANAEPPGSGGGRRPQQGDMSQMTPEMREAMQRRQAEQGMATRKMLLAQQEGAAVVIEPGRGDGGNLFVQSATLAYPTDTPQNQRKTIRDKDAPPVLPQVVVSVEHYNRMVRSIQKGVPVQLEVNVAVKYHDQDVNDYNVIAEIPGTDLKDEVVMLGGHYDSWQGGTGATDNAAGCAVAMEAVRLIKASGLQPRRTIRVALWSGEEQGLLGSRAYVEQHYGRRVGGPNQFGPPAAGAAQAAPSEPTFELKPAHEKIAGYFNLDNGTGKIRGVYMQGNEAVRPIFRAWLAPFKDMGASTLTISNTGGTDHQAYDGVGIPGFQFIQDTVEYDSRTHHSTQDVYDRIQEDDMKQAAIVMAAFVYHTAMRDQKLPRKPLPGRVVSGPSAGQK